MKILNLSAYFLPERVSCTDLDLSVLQGFANAGFTTKVLTPVPGRGVDEETRKQYQNAPDELRDGGKTIVHRFRLMKEGKNPLLRALRYLLSNLRQYRLGKKETETDLIFANSTPPTQGFLAAKLKKKLSRKTGREIKFLYELQDIFPDSLVNAGLAKEGGLLWKIGRKIEDYTYRRADRIIVISEGFKKNLLAKGVPEEKIAIISNWADTESVEPISKEKNKLYDEFKLPRDKFLAVYAGNFGETQGVGVILESAKILSDKPIFFVLFGSGAKYEKICKEAEALSNVRVLPLLPKERLSEVYSLGDVGFITCKKGVGKAGLPSKTWNLLACNTPIIASFDVESDLADTLRAAGCGQIVEPENPQALANALLLAMEKNEKPTCSTRDFVKATVSKEICVGKYVDTVRKTACSGKKATD